MVDRWNRGIDLRGILARIDIVPIVRPESTVQGSPHANSPGPLHVPCPAVPHVKDLRGKNAGPPHCLGENLWVGFASTVPYPCPFVQLRRLDLPGWLRGVWGETEAPRGPATSDRLEVG